jgi:hypothetical protein
MRGLWLCAALIVLGVVFPGVASAAPTVAAADTSGVLADLQQYIGGTPEFEAAPWMQGACKDRGGDIGAYIDAVFPVEGRLMYWKADGVDAKRAILLAGSTNPADSARYDQLIAANQEPPANLLPATFPADGGFSLGSLCADDARAWGTPEWNVWKFQWAPIPDTASLAAMLQRPGAHTVPDDGWLDPCKAGGMYCAHAFFLDCAKAGTDFGARERCTDWNLKVADLFAGTANWVDQGKTVGDRIQAAIEASPQYKLAKAYTAAFAWSVNDLVPGLADAAAFVADPQSIIDEWANATKQDAIDLSTQVLQGLADTGDFDPANEGFLGWYASATGIGLLVLAFMYLITVFQAAWHKEHMATLRDDLLFWAPLGVILMLFAPAIAVLFGQFKSALSDAAADRAGQGIGDVVTQLQHFSGELTAPGLPGGVIVGIILFLFLIIGAIGVYAGLLMHEYALPLLGAVCGISFGFYCNPRWRRKALRPLMAYFAVALSQPLLIFLIGVSTAPLSGALTMPGTSGLDLLKRLVAVVVGFVILGLAPWSLIKYFPLLPAPSQSATFGGGGPSLAAGAAGGVAASSVLQRSSRSKRFVGSGGSAAGAAGANGSSGSGGSSGGSGGGPQWLQTNQSNAAPAQSLGHAGVRGGRKAAGTAGKAALHGGAAAASSGASVAASGMAAAARLSAQAMRKAKHTVEAGPEGVD